MAVTQTGGMGVAEFDAKVTFALLGPTLVGVNVRVKTALPPAGMFDAVGGVMVNMAASAPPIVTPVTFSGAASSPLLTVMFVVVW